MSNSIKSEAKGRALQDKEIVAQGSIEYNGQTLAYIVSKSGESYFLDVSFVKGSRKNEDEKKAQFEFKRKSDGRFYLSSKDAPFLHEVFMEDVEGNKSMVLVRGKQEIARLNVFQNWAEFFVMGKMVGKSAVDLDGKKVDIDIDSLIGGLSIGQAKKLKDLSSKFVSSVDERINGRAI